MPVEESKAEGALPMVPPSTAEVSIRTLESDLALMGQSGGMPMAQFMHVPVAGENAPAVGPAGVPLPAPVTAQKESGSMRALIWILVVIAGAAILFAGGYFLAPLFGK